MQRSFSFQAHDDDSEYRALPLLPHDSTPTRQRYTDSPASSLSSVSSISRVGAPSQRSFQNGDLYSSQRQPASGHPFRSPIATAGGNIAGYREQGQNQWREDGAYFMAPAATGDQYLTPRQHSPTDTLYTHPGQASSMSQTNLPLIPTGRETPSSRFADAPPPTPPHIQGRFADPPSPPTPPHAQPREMGENTQEVLPPPPSHSMGTLPNRSTDRVLNDPVGGHYTDNPYKRYSTTWDPQLSASQIQINGTARDAETFVFSDDDEPVMDRSQVGVAAGAAGFGAARGGRSGRSANSPPRSAGTAVAGGSGLEAGSTILNEKAQPSDWLQKQTDSKKKSRWIIGLVLLLVILAAAGGATAGILLKKKNTSSAAGTTGASGTGGGGGGGGLTESQDVAQNGNLDKNSKEIIALMNNPKLKKVFHGMDYTPLNTQYPDCLKNPPTQNNITRDVAVMSLLTNKLRLYGTDCNQTEMVLHAITALDIPMKIWLGVWLDKNTTTNTRQLNSLYTILANYPADRFEGVAVGNEVLFREDLIETQLFSTIADVRSNLSSLSINLPVGTSDLGSNWKSTMVSYIDVLMANVHPFFAGVVVEKAANWTWTFFQENDVILTKGLTKPPRVMISEVGWPSGGGHDSGSVAGINEMNQFMQDFLCTENNRKTEYFWFSAFDEPWKVVYNEPGKEWEDKWGLMDVNRNLKDGLIIPDCLVTY